MNSKTMNEEKRAQCRIGCGACCIVPSISSAIPGMADGKPAGVRCIQLNDNNLCSIFGQPERPKVCLQFNFCPDTCGSQDAEAFQTLTELEYLTR